jgi:hypothetical protein
MEWAEEVFLGVGEEAEHLEVDEVGDGEPDSMVFPLMLQPIHHIPHILQPILNPRRRRKRNSCRRSLLPWKRR